MPQYMSRLIATAPRLRDGWVRGKLWQAVTAERPGVCKNQPVQLQIAASWRGFPAGTGDNRHDAFDTVPERAGGRMTGKSRRGFASMDAARQREIASKGGRAAHAKGTAHEWSSDEAREAGRKGGVTVSRDRAHMAAIGREGGESRSAAARAARAARGTEREVSLSMSREGMGDIRTRHDQSRSDSRLDNSSDEARR